MDRKFTLHAADLQEMGVHENPTSTSKHVPDIECQIQTIKEWVRGLYHHFSYAVLPRLMMVHLIYYAVFWLNNRSPKGGISMIAPRTLMTGVHIDLNKHCAMQFGEYAQVKQNNLPVS